MFITFPLSAYFLSYYCKHITAISVFWLTLSNFFSLLTFHLLNSVYIELKTVKMIGQLYRRQSSGKATAQFFLSESDVIYLLIVGVAGYCWTWPHTWTYAHTVGLIWTRDQPIAETCTCTTQYSQAHSELLYRLRHPGPQNRNICRIISMRLKVDSSK
jgi:hypothetical protein